MKPARCGAGGSDGCGATDYCRFGGRGSASGVRRDLSIAHRTGEPCGAGRHYCGLSRRAFGLFRGAGDGGKSTNGDAMLQRAAEQGVLAALDDRARTGREATTTAEARIWLVGLACAQAMQI